MLLLVECGALEYVASSSRSIMLLVLPSAFEVTVDCSSACGGRPQSASDLSSSACGGRPQSASAKASGLTQDRPSEVLSIEINT